MCRKGETGAEAEQRGKLENLGNHKVTIYTLAATVIY